MHHYPFLLPEFFDALEQSGSVCKATGWQPDHLTFSIDQQQLCMPLYRKYHSWGEYVFDWSWADAYRQHGIDYYPKLLTAIPFTPATGPRLRSSTELSPAHYQHAARLAIDIARESEVSSWHLLFPDVTLAMPELLHRSGVQYHWFNRNYDNFEDFLRALKSRKRKMILRERESCKKQGLSIEMLKGHELEEKHWSFFSQLYMRTYAKRSGTSGYLNEQFFLLLGRLLAGQIAMAIAYHRQNPVAAALYLFDDQCLYGRYWGCTEEFEHLHFELCYYQGIELAIEQKLKKFDAGAQGEHKILRGFEPVETHSYHWIRNPDFREAIADFLQRERTQLLRYRQQAASLLPYRQIESMQ